MCPKIRCDEYCRKNFENLTGFNSSLSKLLHETTTKNEKKSLRAFKMVSVAINGELVGSALNSS